MPIRPENKDRYPADWPAISNRIRSERAKWHCEECGVANGALGGRDSRGNWHPAHAKEEKLLRLVWPQPGEEWWCGAGEERHWLRIVRIVLTVAHLDHTPENCADENLKAMCQRCHNAYDAPERRAGIQKREREKRACGDLFGGGA